jgi:hypothetical protein
MKKKYTNVLKIKGDFDLIINLLNQMTPESNSETILLEKLVPIDTGILNEVIMEVSDRSFSKLKNWQKNNWGCEMTKDLKIIFRSHDLVELKFISINGTIMPWLQNISKIYPDFYFEYRCDYKKRLWMLIGKDFLTLTHN